MAGKISEGLDHSEVFPSTHWSVVVRAVQPSSPQSHAALATLCEDYWPPLYAYVRHRGYPVAEAEDLTQAFFERLIHQHYLAGVSPEGGKFRSFLLTALKRFLANQWHREHAQKRGGAQRAVSIDETGEIRYQSALVEQTTPETLYERQWVYMLLERVLVLLRDEYARAGKVALFTHLSGCLPGTQAHLCYPTAGSALKLSEGAVRMAALRLRRRYGELLRGEIARTVASPEEVDEELRHLMEVTSHP
jgi:RNA polymerase sigma factor (sigma-70 family)